MICDSDHRRVQSPPYRLAMLEWQSAGFVIRRLPVRLLAGGREVKITHLPQQLAGEPLLMRSHLPVQRVSNALRERFFSDSWSTPARTEGFARR